jgi:hypothetical protein
LKKHPLLQPLEKQAIKFSKYLSINADNHGITEESTVIEYRPVTARTTSTIHRSPTRLSLRQVLTRLGRTVLPVTSIRSGYAVMRGWWFVVTAMFICIVASTVSTAGEFTLTRQAIAKIKEEHGESARRRVVQ